MDYFEQRQFSRAIKDGRKDMEQSEYCVECQINTDIRKLNIYTGVCFECKPSKKFNKQEIIDAIEAVNLQMRGKNG